VPITFLTVQRLDVFQWKEYFSGKLDNIVVAQRSNQAQRRKTTTTTKSKD